MAKREVSPSLTVEQAIANLTHEDLSLRYYAAWWLGKFQIHTPAAVNALLTALNDEADRTELGGYPLRRNAARALGKIGDIKAVPALIECLDSLRLLCTRSSAQSLGMLGDPACIPALKQTAIRWNSICCKSTRNGPFTTTLRSCNGSLGNAPGN